MESEFEEEEPQPVPELTRELEKKISRTVRKILEEENLYQMTEKKIREKASDQLELNLSDEPFKSVVKRAVEDFLGKFQKRAKKTSAFVQQDFVEKKRSK